METEEPKIRDVVRVAPSKPSLFKSWAQTHLTLVVLTLSQPCYTNFKLCRDVHSFTVRKNQISISTQTVDGQRGPPGNWLLSTTNPKIPGIFRSAIYGLKFQCLPSFQQETICQLRIFDTQLGITLEAAPMATSIGHNGNTRPSLTSRL
jgi:hypothetical protein